MEEKWYDKLYGSEKVKDTSFILLGGLAGLVLSVGFNVAYKAKYRQQINQIQTADLNHNGIPERFYTIDDKVVLIELDGKPVSELLKK